MKTCKGEHIRELLHEKLEESNMVNKQLWENLTRYVPNNQLMDHLLHEVLSKWSDIRANAFVKTFALIFKRKMNNMLNDKKKQLRSSEPAMRKTHRYG